MVTKPSYKPVDETFPKPHLFEPTIQLDPHEPPETLIPHETLEPMPPEPPISHNLAHSPHSDNNPPLRTSDRIRRRPGYLADYHCNLATNIDPPATTTKHPLSKYLSYNHLSPQHKNFSITLSSITEPATYKDAIQHPHW